MSWDIVFRASAALSFIVIIIIGSVFRVRSDKARGRLSAKPDFPYLIIVAAFMYLLAFPALVCYFFWPPWAGWATISLPLPIRLITLPILIVMTWLDYVVFRDLGLNVTKSSETREEQELVTHGIYRWIRHPLYTVSIAYFLTFGILTQLWPMLVLAVGAAVAIWKRTEKEERNLIAKFGDDYREYMRRTGRFLPWIGRKAL